MEHRAQAALEVTSSEWPGPWLAFREGPRCLLRKALLDSTRSDTVPRGQCTTCHLSTGTRTCLTDTLLWCRWERCVEVTLRLCTAGSSQQRLPLPYPRNTVHSRSLPIREPHSFLSNCRAKRFGFHEGDQVTVVVPCALGPSPSQMSELPGQCGNPRLLGFMFSTIGFYQEEYKRKKGCPLPSRHCGPGYKRTVCTSIVFILESWKGALRESS